MGEEHSGKQKKAEKCRHVPLGLKETRGGEVQKSQSKSFRATTLGFHFSAHNNHQRAVILFLGFYFQAVRMEQILEYCRLPQEKEKIT